MIKRAISALITAPCPRELRERLNAGKPVVPKGTKFWKYNGGHYPHSGFAWCWVREILDKIGALVELGGMGSGDHHMALGIAGLADYSIPEEIGGAYRDAVKLWEARATMSIANLGTCPERSSIAGTAIRRAAPTKAAGICSSNISSTRSRLEAQQLQRA